MDSVISLFSDPAVWAALFTLTVMEGAVMQARTYRTLDAFDEAITCLREYLDAMTVDRPGEDKETQP